MKYPRSPYDTEGGIVHFPRMLDKIRLHAVGELAEDYVSRLGQGMDGFLCEFLGVKYADVVHQVEEGRGDGEMLRWCFRHGHKRSKSDILHFNKFLLKLGWRDEDIGITERLEDYKQAAGHADRDDIQTIFDFIELDEGRRD